LNWHYVKWAAIRIARVSSQCKVTKTFVAAPAIVSTWPKPACPLSC